MPSVAEIERHFASGAETFTFTREAWESFYAHQQTFAATSMELRTARHETERIKRIARPLWRAVARVRRSMARAFDRYPGRGERIPQADVQQWERILRYAQDLDWHDLPAGHPRISTYRR